MAKNIKFYDPETQKIVEIPSTELTANCVGGYVEGIGEVWMVDDGLPNIPIRHADLSKKLRKDIRRIAAEMADLLPQTIEQWEDGFQRQVDPAKEVALWLHMIAVLRECGKGEQLSHDQRMEIYLFVLKYSLCPAGSTDTILDAITPITISRETALKAMRLYDGEKPEEWHKSNIGRVE